MKYCYSNNGLSISSVDDSYVAQSGEILFDEIQTPTELTAAFTGYAALAAVVARAPVVALAQTALNETDRVMLRCAKAGVTFPSAWQTYTQELRDIVNGTDSTSTTLPSTPAYPAGT